MKKGHEKLSLSDYPGHVNQISDFSSGQGKEVFKIILKLLLIALLTCLAYLAFGKGDSCTHCRFGIYKSGASIGLLEAESSQPGGVERLRVTTRIRDRLVIELNIVHTIENIIGPDYLMQVHTERKINGSQVMNHSLQYEQGGYRTVGKKTNMEDLPANIKFSIAMMYFREPVGQAKVYSESHRQMVPIQRMGAGQYRVLLPDNHHTDYIYKGGKLMKVIARSGYGIITFIREQGAVTSQSN